MIYVFIDNIFLKDSNGGPLKCRFHRMHISQETSRTQDVKIAVDRRFPSLRTLE
jgi:hypothetical protein